MIYSLPMPTGQLRSPQGPDRKVLDPTRLRPTFANAPYRQDIAEFILPLLAEGHPLHKACRMATAAIGVISPCQFLRWVYDDQELARTYSQARDIGYRLLADELLDIADRADEDTFVDEHGMVRMNSEVVQRSKLRVDTRKWILAKMLPRLYGDKLLTEHTGANGGPIQVSAMNFRGLSDVELDNMQKLLSKATPQSQESGDVLELESREVEDVVVKPKPTKVKSASRERPAPLHTTSPLPPGLSEIEEEETFGFTIPKL